MNSKELCDQVSDLIANKEFEKAEEFLSQALEESSVEADKEKVQLILSELIELYCLLQPPALKKAEALSLQREDLDGSPYSRLQTAKILQYGARDFARAIPKLQQAIAQGLNQQDYKTAYEAMSMLGIARLELSDVEKALTVLRDIEELVAERQPFVAGDEAMFLEALRARGLEVGRVRRLASTLAVACRDPAFRARLHKLASG